MSNPSPPTHAPPSADIIARFEAVVGSAHVLREPSEMAPYLKEWRGLYEASAACVVRPANTTEVAVLLSIANESKTAIVPQSGNTGLVGGGVPTESGNEVVLSLSRLDTIRAVDPVNNTMTVEAGAILADIHAEAERHDRLFPLSLASEGTCQIGGNLATNAGGTNVLRYGNARDLALGLEVVLADGRVLNALTGLRKDNTGYDLKQLFIGSEGTLGVITAAVLKLFPRPRAQATALVAVKDVAAATELLPHASAESGGLVTGFELMPQIGIDFVTRHVPQARMPLAGRHEWYVLIELSSGQEATDLSRILERVLAKGVEDGLVLDAVIAQSVLQSAALWQLRESMSDAQRHEGASIKHDISVPISAMAEFIERACRAVTLLAPGIRPVPFGHIGDGNVHFNLSQPVDADPHAFLERWTDFNEIVHDIAAELGGSISAEHGIGRLKRDMLSSYKEDVALDLMKGIKRLFDPNNILNPGKVLNLD